jgi:hypothetical protein
MKIRPILFSTEMVQAILAGSKTQTRRTKGLDVNPNKFDLLESTFPQFQFKAKRGTTEILVKCPYGKVGDVLWVRETTFDGSFDPHPPHYTYKADFSAEFKLPEGDKWKPSIFMPKAAARIFLKITNIRVERLNDISKDDAEKEGVEQTIDLPFSKSWKNYMIEHSYWDNPIGSFMTLWQSINGEESWNENPYVWVIEFERIEKPLNF